ncbi:MAG: T9SS type A sorting domain-containing protein [Bacteroidia bacterium]|nr:T9SS type A sorting domain-containing protein [Bacteroidia bacterium]
MRSGFRLPLLLSIATVCFIQTLNLLPASWFPHPAPTEIGPGEETDPARRLARQAWIETLHRAAPGTDWRAQDRATRQQIAAWRMRARTTRSFDSDFIKDTIANGRLRGHWREAGSSNQAGRIHTAWYTDQGVLYLASSGGNIWKGNTDGTQWQVQNDLYQIEGIQFMRMISHNSGQRLVIGRDTWNQPGIMYSDDEGVTWQSSGGLSQILNWGYVKRTVFDPDMQRLYALSLEWNYLTNQATCALYRSDDQATSFSRIATFDESVYGNVDNFDIWQDPFTSGGLYLIIGQQTYSVSPQGATTLLSTNPHANATGSVALTGRISSNGQVYLYAAYQADNQNYIFRSTTGGTSWLYRGLVPSWRFFQTSFSVSRQDPNRLYIGGINAYRSSNGGQTWNLVNEWYQYYPDPATKLHADIPAFCSFEDAQGEFTIVCTDGGAYISRDGLVSVQNISLEGLHVSQYYSTYTWRDSTAVIFAGAQDQGFQKSSADQGRVVGFEQLISGDYGHIVSGNRGQSIWTNYPGFTMHYPDAPHPAQGGTLFSDFEGTGHLWLPPLVAEPGVGHIAWRAGGSTNGGARLHKLTAGPGTLVTEEQPFEFSPNSSIPITTLTIHPQYPHIRYVLNQNLGLYRSLDSGLTWTSLGTQLLPQSHYFYGNAMHTTAANPLKLYVAGSGYSNPGVYVSQDLGVSFEPLANGLPSTLVFDIDGTPDDAYLFAATEVGPYVYVAADNQWYYMGALSAPDQAYWSVEYIEESHTVRFGTYGRGIWDFIICDDQSPEVIAGFTVTPDLQSYSVHLTSTSQGAYFYHWELPGGQVVTEQTEVDQLLGQPGDYTIRLIAYSHCQQDTFEQTVALYPTRLDEQALTQLLVYPVPHDGTFTLSAPALPPGTYHASVTDLTGRTVWQTRLQTPVQADISLPPTAPGWYQVTLRTPEGRIAGRTSMWIR